MSTKTELDEKFEYPDNPAFVRRFWTGAAIVVLAGMVIAAGVLFGVVALVLWWTRDVMP